MLDRSQAPPLREVRRLELPDYRRHMLSNGIVLYEVDAGTQAVFKLEVVFNAGRFQEQKRTVSRSCVRMLREGTTAYDSEQLAEQVDYYGGTLGTPSNLDYCGVVLYGLNKHFRQLLPYFEAAITQPTFPKEELDTFIKESQQEIFVDKAKVDTVSYRVVTEAIFGSDHPYGYNSDVEDYARLRRADLVEHYERNYIAGNCTLFLSGKVEPWMISLLDEQLSRSIPAGYAPPLSFEMAPFDKRTIQIHHPRAQQTAIRIGRRMFNRHHRDYLGLSLVNALLGGYFGSRLMMNIREDKGYTYNIYSSLDTMRRDGYFLISTEVGNDFVEDTLTQIKHEMRRLREEPVSPDELYMLRNYLQGTLLNMIDGPFASSEVIKTLKIEQLDDGYFERFADTIKTIDADTIQRLADTYLREEDMYTVIVGA